MRQAVLLAGGLGTRLQSVSGGMPKPLMPVGGRPFVEHVLDGVVSAGCELVVVAASYRWELLRERLGTNYRGCALEWSIEAQPLGTGGAMRQAFQAFDLERAFVLNADTLFRIDLRALEARHTATGAAVTVALRQVEDVGRYGEVIVAAEGRITQFREKGGQGPGLINGGIYLVDSSVWRQEASPAAFSFERDFLQVRVAEERLFGLGFDAYFIDIGIPEDLDRARRDLGAS